MQREHRLGRAQRAVIPRVPWCLWLAVLVAGSCAWSLPRGAAAQPSLGRDALPGLVNVPSATESSLLAGAATVGFAYTGEVLGLDDRHYGINYDGALSTSPLPQLQIAGGIGARIDTHSGDLSGGTSGFATYGSLGVRGRFEPREHVHLALDATAILPPAKNAKYSLEALTPQFNGVATYQTERYLVTGALGARINRSDRTFPDSTPLSPYEALALGETGETQMLVGVGGGLAAGPVWCVFDLQFEPYVGGGAPPVKYAPLLFGAGVRGDVRQWLQLGFDTQLSLTPDPPAASIGSAVVPPRIWVQAFVAMRWDRPEPEPIVEEPEPEPEPEPPPPPVLATLSGEVTGLHGRPIPDATVHIHLQRGDADLERTLSGGASEFTFADLEQGDWEVRVEAEGYETARRTLRLPAPRPLQIRLDRALPPGHLQVRVQDFRGRQVEAGVVVLPDRTPFQPTSETGLYTLDLAPGKYEIEIVAEGYGRETRTAVVAQNGVTIVVVDLRRSQEAQ